MVDSDIDKNCIEKVNIDSVAFIFNSGCIRAKKSKYLKNKQYENIQKPKCGIFELSKKNFASCSLGVSNSKDDAWNVLNNNLLNLINCYFVISLTNCKKNCKIVHKTYCKLKKYKIKKNNIQLYFNYNINPMENNQIDMTGKSLQFNTDVFYNLEKKEYCNLQFWKDKNYIYTPFK